MFSFARLADYVRETRVPVISMVLYRLRIISDLFLVWLCFFAQT